MTQTYRGINLESCISTRNLDLVHQCPCMWFFKIGSDTLTGSLVFSGLLDFYMESLLAHFRRHNQL